MNKDYASGSEIGFPQKGLFLKIAGSVGDWKRGKSQSYYKFILNLKLNFLINFQNYEMKSVSTVSLKSDDKLKLWGSLGNNLIKNFFLLEIEFL